MNIPSYIFTVIVAVADYYFIRWALDVGFQPRDPATFYVIGALLLGLTTLVISGITYQILASRKGKLTIIFKDRPYEPGETVSGKLKLETKSMLEINALRLTFAATRTRRDDEHMYEDVIWKKEIDLLSQGMFSALVQEFDFSFTLPNTDTPRPEGLMQSLMHHAVKGTTHWELEARLDVLGVDLYAQQVVRVNDGDLF